MAFDRQTNLLWAADVGQDLFEEIDIIHRGGNYGWNLREGAHLFGSKTAGEGIELIDPVWEYDHRVGKSITGGLVYRGKRLPELAGHYVYADFVSGRLWALDYDHRSEKVIANREIPGPSLPVSSFGEDEQGELFFTVIGGDSSGIYRFVPRK
jgi:glucose/arabinose dehydrogenase